MQNGTRTRAIVTGASSGIGYELAKICAREGFDLVLAADRPLDGVVAELSVIGAGSVEAVEADLSTTEGVDRLYEQATRSGPVDALLANAGHGLGHGFLDQDFDAIRHVVETNITGTIYLIHKVGRDMRARNEGRILITGSTAGWMPGAFQAVYNASKAFIDSFSYALRNELKDTNVTVSCLMPGPTDTEFFERADMLDTKVGTDKKDDPADVAKAGFKAMMSGDAEVVAGWKNKVETTIANVIPPERLAEMHRNMAEPGSGER